MTPLLLLAAVASAPPNDFSAFPPARPVATFSAFNAVAPAKPAGISWQTDYDKAYDAAEKAGKPMLLLYTVSKGCPACDQFSRGALADPAVAKAAAGLVCVKIDTATKAGARLAAAVGVTSVPYLCVHPAAGKPAVAELSGVRTAAEVVEALGKVAAPGVAAARPFAPGPDTIPATGARPAAGLSTSSPDGTGTARTSTGARSTARPGTTRPAWYSPGCPPAG